MQERGTEEMSLTASGPSAIVADLVDLLMLLLLAWACTPGHQPHRGHCPSIRSAMVRYACCSNSSPGWRRCRVWNSIRSIRCWCCGDVVACPPLAGMRDLAGGHELSCQLVSARPASCWSFLCISGAPLFDRRSASGPAALFQCLPVCALVTSDASPTACSAAADDDAAAGRWGAATAVAAGVPGGAAWRRLAYLARPELSLAVVAVLLVLRWSSVRGPALAVAAGAERCDWPGARTLVIAARTGYYRRTDGQAAARKLMLNPSHRHAAATGETATDPGRNAQRR